MKDIHNHSLFGIDDGSNSIEDSIELLKRLSVRGFTDIILTPHYIEGTRYIANNEEKLRRIEELRRVLKNENININLHIGNEVFITSNIKELIESNEISTLNNSRYVLVELSIFNKLSNDIDILLDLIKNGYIPILAHPERYEYYREDLDIYRDLVNKGVLLQGNLFSLLHKNRKKVLIKLLKENLISFIATDIHRKEDKDEISEALKILDKVITKEKQEELFSVNITCVLENKLIKVSENKKERRSIFSIFRKKN